MEKQIVSSEQFGIMIERLAHQLIENHGDFSNTIIQCGIDMDVRFIQTSTHLC